MIFDQKVRQRELKFFEQKKNATIKELRRYGIEINQLDSDIIPTAYITGEKEFFKLRFFVSRDTMIPRPSTEYLVRAIIDIYLNKLDSGFWKDKRNDGDNMFSILDCGTGSGCILISVLHYILSQKVQITKTISPHVFGLGLDISPSALEIARKNAERHLKLFISNNNNYDFQKGDFTSLHNCGLAHKKHFDILVCNPPYLDIAQSLPNDDARNFEPPEALFAEENGYKFYRMLYESLEHSYTKKLDILKEGSLIILEVGSKMAEKVEKIFTGWKCIKTIRDHQGFVRCLIFTRNSSK